MAYTGSKAISGRGSQFLIGGVTGAAGTGSETFTLIGEVSSAGPEESQWATEDTTNFQSGNVQEFYTTIFDPGMLNVSGNRVSTDPGQIALQAAVNSGLRYDFKLILPLQGAQTTTGDTYVYSGLAMSYAFPVESKSIVKFTCKIKVSGVSQFTPGS